MTARRVKVYEVSSTYKVEGVAFVEASSAAEAVRKGLDPNEGVIFDFSEPYGETKMRARLLLEREAEA